MWRALRPNKEDRIAKLEWSPTGGLGRVMMGKVCGFFFSLYEGQIDHGRADRTLCEWLTSRDRTLQSTFVFFFSLC